MSIANTPTDKPQEDQNIRGDPFRTLFVSRLSYEVEPKDLEREFGRFGPIERVWSWYFKLKHLHELSLKQICILQIRIVNDINADEKKDQKKKKKHRGYAFIVFEREKDMKGWYLFIRDTHLNKYMSCIANLDNFSYNSGV